MREGRVLNMVVRTLAASLILFMLWYFCNISIHSSCHGTSATSAFTLHVVVLLQHQHSLFMSWYLCKISIHSSCCGTSATSAFILHAVVPPHHHHHTLFMLWYLCNIIIHSSGSIFIHSHQQSNSQTQKKDKINPRASKRSL